jgi:hypothetical protein
LNPIRASLNLTKLMRKSTALLVALLLTAGNPLLRAQITETNSFANLNMLMPEGDPAGMINVQAVNSAITNLSALRVSLSVAGDFNGDLYGYLRHVQGSVTNFCVLLNRVGRTASDPWGYADCGLNVLFDDAASQGDIHIYETITDPPIGTPLTGAWQPDGRDTDPSLVLDTTPRTTHLSSFTNSSPSGNWTLFLADMSYGSTNMLVSWGLLFTGPAAPPITWPTPASIVYGAALGANQLNATSSLPGTFTYNPPAGTVLNAGSQVLSVTFNPTDTSDYVPVTANVTLVVLPESLSITPASASKLYGAPVPALTASYSGFVNGDTAGSLTTAPVLTTTATVASPVGSYTITASGAASSNYTISYATGALVVNPAALTITAANAGKLYGAPLPALTASYSGFVNGDTAGSLTTAPVLTTRATAASPVGSYTITASGAAGANYTFIYAPGTLVVSKASTAGALSSSANPSLPDQAVTFSLTLSAVAPGAGTPTGTVQFEVDGAAAGAPVSLSGGAASYMTTNLTHGSHTVSGQYTGDTNFLGMTNLLSPAQVVNTPPVAGPVTLYRGIADGVKVSIADLLTNVTDADGDRITFVGVSPASANGGTVVTNEGWVFYTPAPGFTNTDTFTYLVTDGWSAPVSGIVTVDITVDTGTSRNLVIANLGGGSVAIGGDGIPGSTYIIQYATNTPPTMNWVTLGTVTADSSGAFVLVETFGSGLRFYRAIYP